MKNNKILIKSVVNKNIKVISIDKINREFTTDDNNTYPLLFDVDEDITIEDFQKALDESKNIILNIINNE